MQKGEKGSEAELSPSAELWASLRLSAKSLCLAVIDAAIAEDSKNSQICDIKEAGCWGPLVGAAMPPSVERLASFMFDGASLGFLLPSH